MKTSLTFLLCLFVLFNVSAQKTTFKGKLPAFRHQLATISRPTKWLMYDTPRVGFIKTRINQSGEFSFNLDHIHKEIIILEIKDSTESEILFRKFFYIEKGYNLSLTENSQHEIVVSGPGAENNHLMNISTFYMIETTEADSLPDRLYKTIQNLYDKDKTAVDSISKIYKLPVDCSEALQLHLKYVRLSSFYGQFGNLRLIRQPEILRNHQPWLDIFNRLQKEVPLSDEKALAAPSYYRYLRIFIDRKYEDVQADFYDKPDDFYQTWFGGDSLTANAAMQKDPVNQLKQKIIEKYFTGKVKEQMYAFLFDSMVEEQLFDNAGPLFRDFKRQFPKSEFARYFEKPFNEAIIKAKNPLTEKMIFLDKVKSWESILTQFKGKTVLLDMWGTWCGPCRQEINEHAAALKQHFAGKNVSFLYIANFDRDIEKWKKVIAFYNMEGNHILASRDFTAEIMEKIKGYGYPTYAIIDKYGKVELSKANSPLNRKVLIQQIEEALGR